MAASVAECEELIEIAEKNGLILAGRPHLPLLAAHPEDQRDHPPW